MEEVTKRARQLRRDSTWAEKLMWRMLRDRRFNAYKFRRQHPVGTYILDFFCEEALLAVELDGRSHGTPDQAEHDHMRDRELAGMGIEVLRFWNSKLKSEQRSIRDTIFRTLQQRVPKPESYERGTDGKVIK